MRGRHVLVETRRRAIAEAMRASGAVTIGEVEDRFGVSPMTARRDLAELERRGVVRRTHGGAVLPTVSGHEDPFARRLKVAAEAKRRLAEAAVAAMAPHEAVFLDCSTTSYFVARRMVETGMTATVLTNSLPVMELVFHEGQELELVCAGGTLRRLARSFVGPAAVRTVEAHYADRVLMSVKGLTAGGVMTDADPLEAEVKRAMIAQSGVSVLLVDDSKLTIRGLSVIAPASEVTCVLAVGLSAEQVAGLRASGATVEVLDAPADAPAAERDDVA
jgi:DeoR/GlpR family transcriptional regulator of sugar metabolism